MSASREHAGSDSDVAALLPPRILWLAGSLLFVAAVLYAILLTTSFSDLVFHDEFEYLRLAERLKDGLGYVDEGGNPIAFRPPGYPAFVAGILFLIDRVVAVQIMQGLLHAGTALMILYMGARYFGSTLSGAVLSFIFVLFYPIFFYTSLHVYPQTLTAFLLVALFGLIHFADATKVRSVFAAALTTIVLVIITPLFLPIAVANAVVAYRRCMFILFLAIVVCGTALWPIRNYFALGGFAFSTNAGLNLLLGNSPNSAPNLGVRVELGEYHQETAGMSELEHNKYYQKQAVEWILNNPLDAATLYLGKLLNFFNFENRLATDVETVKVQSLVMFIAYYGLLLPSVLFGILRFRSNRVARLVILNYLLGALIYSVFFNRVRYRVPLDYMVFMLSGPGLMLCVDWLAQVRRRLTGPVSPLS